MDMQEKRIAKILSEGAIDEDKLWKSYRSIKKYLKYLRDNIEFPCIMTGIEDFPWEEKYVFGYGSKQEYEQLKKNNPSYKDKFELISLEKDEDNEQILAKVKRVSDKKEFVIGLDWLQAVDEKSTNYQLFDDYATWHTNY